MRKLNREQPQTLFTIIGYKKRHGSIPSAAILGDMLKISKSSASMRIKRLRDSGYLIKQGNAWTVDGSIVVSQPETARVLLAFTEKCAESSGGRLREEELLALMSEGELDLDDEGKRGLIKMMLKAGYISRVDGWRDNYETGTQINMESKYIELLAGEGMPEEAESS